MLHQLKVALFTFGLLLGGTAIKAWSHATHSNQDPNAVFYNGDFNQIIVTEDGLRPDHWMFQCTDKAFATLNVDPTSRAEAGSPSSRISVNNTQASLLQVLNRVPQGSCTLSGWFKKDATLKGWKVTVLAFRKGSRVPLQIPVAEATSDQWTQFSQAVEMPSGYELIVLSCQAQGQGRAWVDDLQVQEEK